MKPTFRKIRPLALVAGLAALVAASATFAVSAGDGDWSAVGRTHDEQFYSPLTQIDENTVRDLGLAWSFDLDTERGVEGAPLYDDGVLYVTSAWNITRAFDARTGKILWTYDPKVPAGYARWACCDVDARGLALWKDTVIIATLDGRVIALDKARGTPVWTAETFDREGRYASTGAPRVFNGIVVIGNGGADANARGFVTAIDADTGKRLWRFYTVPGNPAAPDGEVSDKPLRELAEPTWKGNGEWWKLGGGGTAWDALVYDEELDQLYIGVGNGGPMAQAQRSPGGGDNLFLASIVAVKPETGEYLWHYQANPGEQWDYTNTQPIVLADIEIDGRKRKVLMQAPKNGFFYVIDRTTGKLISAQPYAPQNWAQRIDLATGRPVENAAVTRDGDEPRLMAPGPGGAHNWHPMSYNPRTGLVYFPVTEHWIAYPFRSSESDTTPEQDAARRKKLGELSAEAERREKAWLTAWDPVAQKEVWRVPHSRPGSGGALSTAGNLVFQGNPDRKLAAYRASDGKMLWQFDAQNVPIAAPITYTLDGEQYVAATTGWGGGMALVEMGQGKPPLRNGPARLLVFKLGDKGKLPPFDPASVEVRVEPPLSRAPEARVEKGRLLYADKCAQCHGTNARGGLKDLRWLTRETHAQFEQIVLGGLRADKGMPDFSSELTKEQVGAIHDYVIARANEDFMDK